MKKPAPLPFRFWPDRLGYGCFMNTHSKEEV